jgi:flagellar basal-body rod modification protein FlgD
MVNLIGKRVVVPGSEFSLDGEKPVTLRFDLQGEASPSEMIIRNSNGDVVRRISITDFIQGANELQFDGMDEDGNLLESGNYTFDIAMANDEGNENLATYSNLLVDAVSFDGTSILLKSDGTTIDLGDISEVISNQGG